VRASLLVISCLAAMLHTACGRVADAPASADAGEDRVVPHFEVDPFWPKPLPDNWVIGSVGGISVDERDHVWIVHRPQSLNRETEATAGVNTPAGACCVAAPPVLEFDPDGNVVSAWGGPADGYDWPGTVHGITVDQEGRVWIGGADASDAHILTFTRDGQFLRQFGTPRASQGSHDPVNFGHVAKVSIDPAANEAYVADGYGNRRVVVLDAASGARKRDWGAYGSRPDDADPGAYDPDAPPAPQFRNPVHCAEPSLDGLVYVCDRVNDRIQVFRTDGTFVRELLVEPRTRGAGSVWDIAFSSDPEQRYLYVADGTNERIHIVERASMEILTSFGGGGRQPGQFFGVHSIATDSSGNVYTAETFEGKRLQKFIDRGRTPVPAGPLGPAWPSSAHP
jgi:DNA-binding beta-propeller fold protein YncE